MNSQIKPMPFLRVNHKTLFKALLTYRWFFSVQLAIFFAIYELIEHRDVISPVDPAFLIELIIFSLFIPLLVGFILSLLVISEESRRQVVATQSIFDKINQQVLAVDNLQELCELAVRFPFEIAPFSHSYFFLHKDLLTDSFVLMSAYQDNKKVQMNYPTELRINSIKQTRNGAFHHITEENYPGISIPEGYTGYCFPFITGYTNFAMLHLYLPVTHQLTEKETNDLHRLISALFFSIIQLAPFLSNNMVSFEQERLRLTRHLHDTVGQNLGFLLMKVDLFKKQTKSIQSNEAQKLLEEMQQITNEAYDQVRFTLTNLNPSNTQDLAATIYQNSVLIASRQSGLEMQMTQEGEPVSLSIEIKQIIVAICREGLINIIKHAQATKVELTLNWQSTHLLISMKDNGTGIQPKTDQTESFGLRMMFERASEINGTMKLKSQAGQGLEVILRIPLPAHEASQ